MFINNPGRKAAQQSVQSECLCSLFESNETGNKRVWREGKQGGRSFNNTPRSQVDISKISENSKKLSVSSWIRDRKQREGAGNQTYQTANCQPQESRPYAFIDTKEYLRHNAFTPKNSGYQGKLEPKYAPQILSVTQSASFLETITTPKSAIYHRKIIQRPLPIPLQQSMQPGVQKGMTQRIECHPSHQSHVELLQIQKPSINQNSFQRNQLRRQAPLFYPPSRHGQDLFKTIKEELEVPETLQIINSKTSKGGLLSTQSTDINKESKNFSYARQNHQRCPIYEELQNRITEEFVPFVSEIQPICANPPILNLNKFKSIESINNTNYELDNLDISVVLEKPYKFAKLERPHQRQKESRREQEISIDVEKERWHQFKGHFPQNSSLNIDGKDWDRQYF